MLTGFWHGAEWTFIIWGLLFALLLMIEKTPFGGFLKKCKPVAHIYVTLIILLSFVLFNSGGVSQMVGDFKGLFGAAGIAGWNAQTGYYLRSYAIVILIAAIGATPLPTKLITMLQSKMLGTDKATNVQNAASGQNAAEGNKATIAVWSILEIVFVLGLLIICTAFLVDGSFNPFLYFRF